MLIVQTLPDILRMLSFTGIHYRNALLENYRQKTMTRGTNAVRSDVSSMFITNDFIGFCAAASWRRDDCWRTKLRGGAMTICCTPGPPSAVDIGTASFTSGMAMASR